VIRSCAEVRGWIPGSAFATRHEYEYNAVIPPMSQERRILPVLSDGVVHGKSFAARSLQAFTLRGCTGFKPQAACF